MKVGIIGAGTMGSGIAQAFAQTEGYEVFLCDINEEFALFSPEAENELTVAMPAEGKSHIHEL